MEYEYRWRNWLDLEWSLWYILGIIFSFIDCVLIYRCINFIEIYKSFDIIWNINNYKNIKIDYETKFWIDNEKYLHQICVIFISGIHGVWYMGQFGSSIGIWNQYSKIFRNHISGYFLESIFQISILWILVPLVKFCRFCFQKR